MTVLERIVDGRRARVAREGHALGASVPVARAAPLVDFDAPPLVICELKRQSPSRGIIAAGLDPVVQTGRYTASGVRHVSVLTEPDHFAGSLDDLMAVKTAHPNVAVLRKDFLLDEEDIGISYRAGADAVLLIASVLAGDRLLAMHRAAERYGMAALVEVHDAADIGKVRPIRPPLVGINARDLSSFITDHAHPLRVRQRVDWPATVVFESGIQFGEQARVARAAGFDGVLVGEGAVRRPELAAELVAAYEGVALPDFWGRLYSDRRTPLVKICGLTHPDDVRRAVDAGASMVGFVLADSLRRADPELIAGLGDVGVPKVGVVVDDASPGVELQRAGHLDALQLHGDEAAGACAAVAQPYFKALRIADVADLDRVGEYRCPRVLIDAPRTGTRLADRVITRAGRAGPVWLAGGLTPGTIGHVVKRHRPELVDVSSALESGPGRKDPAKLRAFFDALGDRASAAA